MKVALGSLWVLFFGLALAQAPPKPMAVKHYASCKTNTCRIRQAFSAAEYFLERDAIEASQQWLNRTKDLLNPSQTDTTGCYVHSLQSELFYYNGLFQFGKNEARKEIAKAQKMKDSLLQADGYFFLAINQFELGEYTLAQGALWRSRDLFPKHRPAQTLRAVVREEYIHNNLAQIKARIKQFDSAAVYNRKAYQIALREGSRRGIPNAEQTFGEIFLLQEKTDSAVFYFRKSLQSAQRYQYHDIALLNYGFLLECFPGQAALQEAYYQNGLQLINTNLINSAYKKLFFTKALAAFKKQDPAQTIYIQEQLLALDKAAQLKGNLYFQNFTQQYVRNEKRLLSLEVLKLKKQKDIVLFQLLIAILAVVLLVLAIMYIRRKNRINATLLNQKNEISKDLHDDIGSGISSILIHAELLQKGGQTPEKQQFLSHKISTTAREVSQRINTFIWSLNQENNSLRDFMEYLKNYSENLFEGTPVELRFIEAESTRRHYLIDGKTRKNLFFGLKEIFNNALKHSAATAVTVRVNVAEKKELQLTVSDNGIGFQQGNNLGNGLKNLRKRVAEMKGTLHMDATNGLTTTIRVPLSE